MKTIFGRSMTSNTAISEINTTSDWYSEEFIYNSVTTFLKENGYKVQKENAVKEEEAGERKIVATKFFRREIIEVKGYPNYYDSNNNPVITLAKSPSVKHWFSEALFNSFVNFSLTENSDVAIALPNVPRYRAMIKRLNDYFTVNDLYFKIYLVNEDRSVDIVNLNEKYSVAKSQGK